MATYLVGEQKSTFFSSNKNWNLEDAIEAAQDGDTIEIEDGFRGNYEDSIIVNKTLHIVGHFKKNQDGSKTFTTVLNCHIHIMGGATVTLQDLWITEDVEKMNCIWVKNSSTLVAQNIQIENTASSGENYPIVYIDGQSTVKMNEVFVHKSQIHDGNHRISVHNSRLEISNSTVNAKIYVTKKSTLVCDSIVANYTEGSVIVSDSSSLLLKNSTFTGGQIKEKNLWPCVHCNNTDITITDVTITENEVLGALFCKNTKLKLTRGIISSINLIQSEANFDDAVISESVSLQDSSTLIANIVNIYGNNHKRISLYANKKSKIKADSINLGNPTNPNIRFERNTEISVPKLNIVKYDPNTGKFISDGNNQILVMKKAEIDYFGKDTSANKQLQDLIGIKDVKSKVAEFVAVAQMNKKRASLGLSGTSTTLHSLYLGNPGTGKTTVARLVGQLLYEKKVIKTNKLIEVSRADLVGKYIGKTAPMTRAVLESALGGVLFIDEAYTLAGEDWDYGSEAIDEILKFMEDHRDDLVIIFAGYTKEMNDFINMNPGLKSRIPNVFNFEDYSTEEIVQIGLLKLAQQKYVVDKSAYAELVRHNFKLSNDHSNGRWVRNLNEQIQMKMALRLSKNERAEKTDLSQITNEDLNAVKL